MHVLSFGVQNFKSIDRWEVSWILTAKCNLNRQCELSKKYRKERSEFVGLIHNKSKCFSDSANNLYGFGPPSRHLYGIGV